MAEQKEYAGLKYIREREAYNNSIGIFRCDKKLEGDYPCPEQCEKCSEYYKEPVKK